jgi:hypothetical protein
MEEPSTRRRTDSFIYHYKLRHRDLLDQDPAFARWLEEEYVPIAGGWMY